MVVEQLDAQKAGEFAERLLGIYNGAMVGLMIDLGHRTGLFEAAAAGAATSEELAARAGLQERYVREWLGSVTTAGIVTYDASTRAYTLPAEHAACLTGHTGNNLAPMSQFLGFLGKHVPRVSECFREGGGVPYEEFRPEFTELMDAEGRMRYDQMLVDVYLPTVPGLVERLTAGANVADVGCGTGHCVNLMAKAFPASRFTGYDIAADAIEAGRAEAAAMGLTNARFEVLDVTRLPSDPPFDAIFAFDSIHDQVDPATVLRKAHEALRPDGVFVMLDIRASSNLEENLGHPLAPMLYAVSTLHCMTVSLAHGGAGLGTVWGEQVARAMLAEAGFSRVRIVEELEADPINALYECRR
jgi:SAM-dependent methyltransferase